MGDGSLVLYYPGDALFIYNLEYDCLLRLN